MNEDFVPFSKSRPLPAASPSAFQSTVISAPQALPFLPAQPAPRPSVPSAPAETCRGEPQLSVERDGDRISRIIIRCACGEVIEVDCTY